MSSRPWLPWVGVGAGLAAAGAATVAGLAADRLWQDRREAIALGEDEDFSSYPDHEQVVLATDGVPLHVEVDEPEASTHHEQSSAAALPTVVMCHGYTLDSRCWVYQRRALVAAGYRVVVWDHRGHGASGPGESESYTMEQLADDLACVIGAVAPDGPLALVGHSMGGMAIMCFAQARPEIMRERIFAVGFVSTSAGGIHRITWGLGSVLGNVVNNVGPLALRSLSAQQEFVDRVLRGGRRLQELVVYRASFASPVSMAVVRLTTDMIFGTRLSVMADLAPALNAHDQRAALQQLSGVEVLVINGEDDILTSPVHSDELVREMAHAEHVMVTDAGHILMLEHPDTLSVELVDLLQRGMRSLETKGMSKGKDKDKDKDKDYAGQKLAQRGAGRHAAVTDLSKRRSRATRRHSLAAKKPQSRK